uniref:Uncharacterized protein n=1 Tax=Acrobeloides nanus TaxID=290746 RepID=A0A914C457_9BILA
MLKRNSYSKTNSSRKLAKKLGIFNRAVHEIVKEDLGMKPYKLKERQKLTEEMKATRLEQAQALKRRFANGLRRRIVYSDEKLFTIEQAFNRQIEST